MLRQIISGGQTGVDRAALDAAIACGVEHGGWLPLGRKTEDGPLPKNYVLQELPSPSYPRRTRKNVEGADATLIISHGQLTGGSALTAAIAAELNKPWLHVDLAGMDTTAAIRKITGWLRDCEPEVLNVAGPRASSDADIYQAAYQLVFQLLEAGKENKKT